MGYFCVIRGALAVNEPWLMNLWVLRWRANESMNTYSRRFVFKYITVCFAWFIKLCTYDNSAFLLTTDEGLSQDRWLEKLIGFSTSVTPSPNPQWSHVGDYGTYFLIFEERPIASALYQITSIIIITTD